MQKRFEKGSEHAQMMIDFVKLVQDFYIVEKTDEYWDKYEKRMIDFVEKYKQVDEQLAKRLGLVMVGYIDDKTKG